MGKDIARTVEGMDLLQEGFSGDMQLPEPPSHPAARSGRRLKLQGTDPSSTKAIDDALPRPIPSRAVDDQFRQKWDAAKTDGNTVAAGGTWLSNQGSNWHPGYRLERRHSSPWASHLHHHVWSCVKRQRGGSKPR